MRGVCCVGGPWRAPLVPLIALSVLLVLSLVHAAEQQARKPSETCRASLFPQSNPLLHSLHHGAHQTEQEKERKTPVAHPAFEIRTSEFIDEYGFHAVEYVHSTGATLWSIATPPSEKEMTFSICFRTPASNSFGTAHVFEHAVFEGSEKFPVTSLFSKIDRRSLNTYLNATTFPDRTCYPLASLNTVDFYNLIGVYMDIVFRPLAVKNPLLLAQEGWRYELQPVDNYGTEVDCIAQPDACVLKYSGVVVSEMKGVWDNPDAAEEFHRIANLFPNIETYVHSSGGLPKEIPNLTLKHLQDFHKAHYTPQNSWIVMYGPDDVLTRLNFIDLFFKETNLSASNTNSQVFINSQLTFNEPKYVEYPVASSSPTLKDMVTVSWVLNPCPTASECPEIDSELRAAFQVLGHLLMETKASPLRKALASSKLGDSVMEQDLDMSIKHAIFTVGLKGVKHADGTAAEIEALVLETLSSLVSTGFSADEIAASLNAVEFRLREFLRSYSVPRGLTFSRFIDSQVNYNRNPVLALRFADAFSTLREKLAEDKRLFEKMIQKYLLQNPHRLTLRLKASKTLAAEVAEEEKKVLENIKNNMTPEELKEVIRVQEDLKRFQTTPNDPLIDQTVPKMQREDINPTGEEIPLVEKSLGLVPLLMHELPSAGLVYIDIALSLADLSLEDLSYMHLLTSMLHEAGTTQLSPETLLPLMGRLTGGISATFEFQAAPPQPYTVPSFFAARGFLFLSGKAINSNSLDLVCLMHAMLTDVNFNNSQIGKQIIKEKITEAEDQLRSTAFRAARRTASSFFGAAAFATEQTSGYPNLLFHRELLKQAETDWSVIGARLTSIMQRLLQRKNLVLNITGDSGSLAAATEGPAGEALSQLVHALSEESQFMGHVKGKRFGAETFNEEPIWVAEIRDKGLLVPRKMAFVAPVQVNDVCLARRAPLIGSLIFGSDFVGESYLENVFLYKNIREKRGAYGAWTRLGFDGVFVFMSFRDPHVKDTLATFNLSPFAARVWAETATEDDVLEAILPTISLIDWPLSIDRKAAKSFWEWVRREAPHHRKKFRQQIINTTTKDLKLFAETLEETFKEGDEAVVIVGARESVEEAASSLGDLKIIPVD